MQYALSFDAYIFFFFRKKIRSKIHEGFIFSNFVLTGRCVFIQSATKRIN